MPEADNSEIEPTELPIDEQERQAVVDHVAQSAPFTTVSTFRSTVEDVEKHVDEFQRALHTVERRTFRLATRPAPGTKKKELKPIPAPPGGPWEADQNALKKETHVKAKCPKCDEKKRAPCEYCEGEGRVPCGECRGTGKVYGQRGLKNCPNCRGRGTVGCPECHRGKVKCLTCDGVGRVEAWHYVLHEERQEVTTNAPEQYSRSLRLNPEEGFVAAVGSLTFEVLGDNTFHIDPRGGSHFRDVGAGQVPVERELLPDLDEMTERIVRARVQSVRATTWTTRFGTLLGQGSAVVVGQNMAVLPGADFSPFTRRFWASMIGGGLLAVIALVLFLSYETRHEWFLLYGKGSVILAAGLLAAVSGVFAFFGLTLPPKTYSLVRTWLPLGGVVAALAIAVSVSSFTGPTAEDARAMLERGETEHAAVTADALVKLGIDRVGGGEVLDSLHLRRVEKAGAASSIAARMDGQWYLPAFQEKATRHLEAAVVRETERLYQARDLQGLLALLHTTIGMDEARYRRPIRRRSSLLVLDQCITARTYDCVVNQLAETSRLGVEVSKRETLRQKAIETIAANLTEIVGGTESIADLRSQKIAVVKAIRLSKLHTSISGEDTEPPLAQLESRLAAMERQIEVEDRRLAVERERVRRREERERQRQEQRRQEQQRQERRRLERASRRRRRGGGGGRLRCRDGTLSPSCMCGGSRRGCCSHHGGVAGCN